MEPSVAQAAKSALQQLFEEGLLQASHVQHGTPLPGPAVQRLAALMSRWLRCMHRLSLAACKCPPAVDTLRCACAHGCIYPTNALAATPSLTAGAVPLTELGFPANASAVSEPPL